MQVDGPTPKEQASLWGVSGFTNLGNPTLSKDFLLTEM